MTRRRWILAAGAGLGLSLALSSAAGASDPAPSVAGYNVSSYAAGSRFEFDSPGLLPVGDAAVGEVFEIDVPFTRNTASSGPVADALAAQAYPGDTAAHLGSAIAEFGGPGLPNDSALAEAQYPPSPENPSTASFGSTTPAGTSMVATSVAGADICRASSDSGGYRIVEGSTDLVTVDSSTSSVNTSYANSVASTATASVGTVTVAGILKIEGVSALASASGDGVSATPRAQLSIGSVTVAGQKAYIDQTGVHLPGAPVSGSGGPGSVSQLLNETLDHYGITVSALSPSTSSRDGDAQATSGGVLITINQQVPSLTLPSVDLPGSTLPTGTPGLPVRFTIGLGVTSAAVDTAGVAPASASTPGGVGGAIPGGPTSSGGAAVPQASGSSVPASAPGGTPPVAAAGPGGPTLAAPATDRPRGAAVPAALAVGAVLAALALAGPLLGYARWQLLEGRR